MKAAATPLCARPAQAENPLFSLLSLAENPFFDAESRRAVASLARLAHEMPAVRAAPVQRLLTYLVKQLLLSSTGWELPCTLAVVPSKGRRTTHLVCTDVAVSLGTGRAAISVQLLGHPLEGGVPVPDRQVAVAVPALMNAGVEVSVRQLTGQWTPMSAAPTATAALLQAMATARTWERSLKAGGPIPVGLSTVSGVDVAQSQTAPGQVLGVLSSLLQAAAARHPDVFNGEQLALALGCSVGQAEEVARRLIRAGWVREAQAGVSLSGLRAPIRFRKPAVGTVVREYEGLSGWKSFGRPGD